MNERLWGGIALAASVLGCSGQPSDVHGQQSEVTITGEGFDCSAYNQYTAALATHTVDCLGTISPESFRVSDEGVLERTFDSCPQDSSKLRAIDSILLLQQRTARLPIVRECFAGRYADFSKSFAAASIEACPTWQKERTVNPITAEVIDAVTRKMAIFSAPDPAQPALSELAHDAAFEFPEELEEKNLYTASFTPGTAPAGKSAAVTAAACAAGFPGFVLETDGDSVLTDPVAWLSEQTYPTSTGDPYLKDGYYHPMSWYGGIPGVNFGAYERYAPCPGCLPERCSYYTGVHKITRLQKDCIVDDDLDTCNSYCGPPQ
jgi:hypothetical protein